MIIEEIDDSAPKRCKSDQIFCFIIVKANESCLYGFETRAQAQAGMRFARNRIANGEYDFNHPLLRTFDAKADTDVDEVVARRLVDGEFGENELVIGLVSFRGVK